MKAVVLFPQNQAPQYINNFPEPVASNENQLVLSVKAAAIKNLDKARASGKHYSTQGDIQQAKVIGGDGVGILADGTRVFALGVTGMVAEKAIVEKNKTIALPEGIDDATAAALPNAVAGSAMALRFRAAMQAGETVLINGATGFTGVIAVQIARHYGAKKIIVTGRNEQTLQSLLQLGADEIVSLKQSEENITAQLKQIHTVTPIDIIIDYLWGRSAELLLEVLKGTGTFTHKTRFVSIGAVTGDTIQLSAETIRSVDLQLSGSGLGSWSRAEFQQLFTDIIPEMFQLAADHQLQADTVNIRLEELESLWQTTDTDGKRLVVII
ncbi:NADPH:quinone reductase [Filimonas lacunae]|uniref:NADPH:quinone reductase n=1 Tax=Filimonas lacunae TaxID=477680 RepID=A0A173MBQ5_9BACT|nr:zinc-binding dehydrogenase [Filimonas lacunae]BAV04994.1 quinone oxidoreductase [Filimonas lacunae]SIT33685.1 NADPH:quinone reductase [Filimonas lacunae]